MRDFDRFIGVMELEDLNPVGGILLGSIPTALQ
jgi:hypothetical protein